MTRDALLLHHTHTPDSNRFERAVRDVAVDSHATDYVALARRLPAELDAVAVKTDHWRTDPGYFDRFAARVADAGGSVARFDAHVCAELGGTTAVVVNGVEASVAGAHNHVTVGGLPLDDEGQYHDLTLEELVTAGARAGWVAPAHVGMPGHRLSPSLLSALFERCERAGVPAALGYPTGYSPSYNRVCRNELAPGPSVRELADRHGVPLVPELDVHAALPPGLSGCGVVAGEAVSALRTGELPVGGLLAADLLQPPGCPRGLALSEFLLNYVAFLPVDWPAPDHRARFERSLPDRDRLRALDLPAATEQLP